MYVQLSCDLTEVCVKVNQPANLIVNSVSFRLYFTYTYNNCAKVKPSPLAIVHLMQKAVHCGQRIICWRKNATKNQQKDSLPLTLRGNKDHRPYHARPDTKGSGVWSRQSNHGPLHSPDRTWDRLHPTSLSTHPPPTGILNK